MAPLGKTLTAVTTALVMLVGLALIGGAAWLITRPDGANCIKYLHVPLFILGGGLFGVALMGFIGALANIPVLLLIYLVITFIGMWALLGLTVFSFLVTNESVGAAISNVGVQDMRIPDFSNWMQNQVNNANTWAIISSCIHDSKVCDGASGLVIPGADLHPIETGCCFAPANCTSSVPISSKIALENSTSLSKITVENTTSASTTAVENVPDSSDCGFSPEPSTLCFGCPACKAGLLKSVRDAWRAVAILCLVLVITLFVLHVVGCCGYRNTLREMNRLRRLGS